MLVYFYQLAVQFPCSKGLYFFLYNHDCVEPKECNGKTEHVYRALDQCIFSAPDKNDPRAPAPAKDGVYDCKSGQYLVVGENTMTCVDSREECKGLYVSEKNHTCSDRKMCSYRLGGYAYQEGDLMLCITRDECIEKNRFMFDGRCVSASECRENSLYAYTALHRCEYSMPLRNGNFDPEKLNVGIYDCGDRYLDLTGPPRCISRDSCPRVLYDQQRLCLRQNDCKRFGFLYKDGDRV